MELYTSLTQLKMAMNGGVLPPMTSLTDRAAKILDPAFTIGMGAIVEDPEKGLRCPVRGCGRWFHFLARHAAHAHPSIGGALGIKMALDIPTNAPLVSQTYAAVLRARAKPKTFHFSKGHKIGNTPSAARKGGARRSRNARSVGARNLRDSCEAQLKHKYIDLQNKNGRQPSEREFSAEHGPALVAHLKDAYGTWNNAVTHFGFEPMRRFGGSLGRPRKSQLTGIRLTTEYLLDGLRAWYDAHGDLPGANTVIRGGTTPLLHSYRAYLRAFKVDHWPEAMRRAASLLNIYGGRYGLPVRTNVA